MYLCVSYDSHNKQLLYAYKLLVFVMETPCSLWGKNLSGVYMNFRLQRVTTKNSVLSIATNSCGSMCVLKKSRYSQKLWDMSRAPVRLSCCQPSDLHGINHFSCCHYMLQSQASVTGCREAVWRFVTCGTNCDFIYSAFPFLSTTNVRYASQSRGMSS